MKMDTITYRSHRDGSKQTFTGDWGPVPGGIVLQLTNKTEYFVPFHNVENISRVSDENEISLRRDLKS